MTGARAIVLAALVAAPAWALEDAQWPPPDATASRMRELQQQIISRDSTPEQRNAAREELGSLLRSPAGQQRGPTVLEKSRAPRAAISDPVAVHAVPVAPPAPTPEAGVARLEVLDPPARPLVSPRTGSVATPIAPSQNFAIDPRTGAVLHGTGSGFVDPRTGQFTPR